MFPTTAAHSRPLSQSQASPTFEVHAKAFSCLRCFERKIKCDKTNPCCNCIKSSIECQIRKPPAPRRKKKRTAEELLIGRLKRTVDRLRNRGVLNDAQTAICQSFTVTPIQAASQVAIHELITPAVGSAEDATDERDDLYANSRVAASLPTGKLIVSQAGGSRFIDNHLWTSIQGEFSQSGDALDSDFSTDSDNEAAGDESCDIVLGLAFEGRRSLAHLHPSSEDILKLWRIFLENVNPLAKVIHYPSLQEQVIKVSGDQENVGRGLEVLMFAIYVSAVVSMAESECYSMFRETKTALLLRYRQGCKRALSRAKFLGTSDLAVLQGFVLYLLVMRDSLDTRTMGTLASVASRLAQGLGLHRDGSTLGLPVFETELRRRTWWQISLLDCRSSELTGSGLYGDQSLSDTKIPRNVDDKDIWPGQTEQELEDRIKAQGENRATEMINCLMRCEFAAFLKEKMRQTYLKTQQEDGGQFTQGTQAMPRNEVPEEWDVYITELEKRLEEKFLRYCDPSIPLHLLASIMGRAAIASTRFMMHHPKMWKNEQDIPPEERQLLWRLSVKLMETDALMRGTKELQGFLWHSNVYFPWHALIYLLGELKKHVAGEDVEYAWTKIDGVYEHHPELILRARKPLNFAVGSLCLKAWDARARGRHEAKQGGGRNTPELETPSYIEMLRQQRTTETGRCENQNIYATANSSQSFSAAALSENRTSNLAPQNPSYILKRRGHSGNTGGEGADMIITQEVSYLPTAGANQFVYGPLATFDPDNSRMGNDPSSGEMQGDIDWTQWDYLIQTWGDANAAEQA